MDGIQVNDIQYVGEGFSDIMALLINTSLKTESFPESLKPSIIRPIYKTGPRHLVQNSRPIATLSVIEKFFDRYLAYYLNKYLEENKIIYSNQYRFQKGKGTETLLLDFSDYVNTCLHLRNHVITIFIDYSKAFDTLDYDPKKLLYITLAALYYDILIKELEKLG
jgi:hypothetical protein